MREKHVTYVVSNPCVGGDNALMHPRDHNRMLVAENTLAEKQSGHWRPLHSLCTGIAIDRFPKRTEDIKGLSSE